MSQARRSRDTFSPRVAGGDLIPCGIARVRNLGRSPQVPTFRNRFYPIGSLKMTPSDPDDILYAVWVFCGSFLTLTLAQYAVTTLWVPVF